ncbi:MAG: CinA family protein [Undibacterium sp.]|nr:CinA family protein [Opitutaceae bacterium]
MSAGRAASAAAELKALMSRAPKLTLAVAESVTAGHVQARIAAVPGASGFFLGGVTAYTLEQKVKLLGVNRAAAKKANCVSAAVAEEMALGVCGLFGADVGVATTGYAEPAPGDGVTTPMAWWAVAHRRRGRVAMIFSGRVECPGEPRVAVQEIVAAAVLGELVTYLREWRAGAM